MIGAVGQVKMNQRHALVARGGPDPTNTWRKVIDIIGVNDVFTLIVGEVWKETQESHNYVLDRPEATGQTRRDYGSFLLGPKVRGCGG